MLTLFFFNNKSFEHLSILLRIFFVSGDFQNFDVDFWPVQFSKDGKNTSPLQILERKLFFLKNSIFYHPYESIIILKINYDLIIFRAIIPNLMLLNYN